MNCCCDKSICACRKLQQNEKQIGKQYSKKLRTDMRGKRSSAETNDEGPRPCHYKINGRKVEYAVWEKPNKKAFQKNNFHPGSVIGLGDRLQKAEHNNLQF
jgi:hypothetical protein